MDIWAILNMASARVRVLTLALCTRRRPGPRLPPELYNLIVSTFFGPDGYPTS